MKTCTKCGKEQPFSEFTPHRRMRDGHQSQCKTCCRKYAEQYRNNPKNHAKILAYQRQLRDNPEHRKQQAAYQKKYRKEYKKRDYVKAKTREYIKTPHAKELRRKHGHLWRARKLNAVGDYNARDFEHMLELVEHRCVKCHKKKSLAADHIVPLTQNGCNCIHNLQPLCASCNSKKRNLDFSDYRPLVVHKWLSTIPHKHSF